MFSKIYKTKLLLCVFLLCCRSYKCYSAHFVLEKIHEAENVLSTMILGVTDNKLPFKSSFYFFSFPNILNTNILYKNLMSNNIQKDDKKPYAEFKSFDAISFLPISFGYLWQIGLSNFFIGIGLGLDISRYKYEYNYSKCNLSKKAWLEIKNTLPIEKTKPKKEEESENTGRLHYCRYLNPLTWFRKEEINKENKNNEQPMEGNNEKLQNDNKKQYVLKDKNNINKLDKYINNIDKHLYNGIINYKKLEIINDNHEEKEKGVENIINTNEVNKDNISYKTKEVESMIKSINESFKDFIEEEKKEEKKEEEKKEEINTEQQIQGDINMGTQNTDTQDKIVPLSQIYNTISQKIIYNKKINEDFEEKIKKNKDEGEKLKKEYLDAQLDNFLGLVYRSFNPERGIFWSSENKILNFTLINFGPRVSITYLSNQIDPTFGFSVSFVVRYGAQFLWDINCSDKHAIGEFGAYKNYTGDYRFTKLRFISPFVSIGIEFGFSSFQFIFEVKTFDYDKILSKLKMKNQDGYYCAQFNNTNNEDLYYRSNTQYDDEYEKYTNKDLINFLPSDSIWWKNLVFSISINIYHIK